MTGKAGFPLDQNRVIPGWRFEDSRSGKRLSVGLLAVMLGIMIEKSLLKRQTPDISCHHSLLSNNIDGWGL